SKASNYASIVPGVSTLTQIGGLLRRHRARSLGRSGWLCSWKPTWLSVPNARRYAMERHKLCDRVHTEDSQIRACRDQRIRVASIPWTQFLIRSVASAFAVGPSDCWAESPAALPMG